MKYLNFNHDVIGVQIYDIFEKEFPDLGLIQVHNSESNQRVWIDTSNKKTILFALYLGSLISGT